MVDSNATFSGDEGLNQKREPDKGIDQGGDNNPDIGGVPPEGEDWDHPKMRRDPWRDEQAQDPGAIPPEGED